MGRSKIIAGMALLALIVGGVWLALRRPAAKSDAGGMSSVEDSHTKGIRGSVRTSTGLPMARAEVLLVGPRMQLDLYDQTQPKVPFVKTDNEGNFAFQPIADFVQGVGEVGAEGPGYGVGAGLAGLHLCLYQTRLHGSR